MLFGVDLVIFTELVYDETYSDLSLFVMFYLTMHYDETCLRAVVLC